MAQSRRSAKNSFLLLFVAMPMLAAQLPAGAELPIRLKSKVSTTTSRAGDRLDAVVIGGPLMGAVAHGKVEKVVQSSKGDERSVLVLRFDEIESGGTRQKLEAQVAGVENAREQVNDQGEIQGILSSETITGKLDAGINKVAFQGRLTRASRLSPGSYTVTIVATNALRQRSRPERLSFTIAAR